MLPSAAEMIYFLEVASTQNISRAAERLGITQPTLSVSIQRLEQTLGAPLLFRSKTGVRLTRVGARFAAQAKILLEQWEKIRSDAISEESQVRGQVSVGCHPAVASYTVGGFSGQLMRENLGLELVFHHDLSRKLTEQVISFELDCAIVVNPVQHPDLRIVSLGVDEVTLWQANGASADDVLIYDPDLQQSQGLLQKLKKMKLDRNFPRAVKSSSLDAMARMASAGAGVAILPTRLVNAASGSGVKLRKWLPGNRQASPKIEDRICLVSRVEARGSLALKTVLLAIQKSFE